MKCTEFSELTIAVSKITGIRILTPAEIKVFHAGKGLDLDLTPIFVNSQEELYVNINGSNKRAIVHICDISNWRWRNNNKLPKFHIFDCIKRKEMINNNKGHRYKIAGRGDGMFWIITKKDRGYKKLGLCGYCNQMYGYNNNNTFNLAEWIKNPIDDDPFTNQHYDMTTPKTKYTHDWPEISKNIKEKAGYVCEKCKICLIAPDTKKYCHVHHKDSNRMNNSPKNLIPLCIECHAKEYGHGDVKNLLAYKQYMATKRYTR